MGWWSKVYYPEPGNKIKIRKGKIIEQNFDLYAASWATTTLQKNFKNRYYCDWLIKASKELKSFYPRSEKRMSDADRLTAGSRIDTMIKILDGMKQEILNG